MKIVWVIMILKADVLLITGQSCAGTYDTLPDLERRSTNYVLAANEAFVSDSLLDSKWYKVNRYNMPTNYSNLDIGMCGTYFPIWMNGSIPGSSEGQVSRNVCIISFYEVCNPVKTIEVVNCSTFMLYKLVPTIHSSGYCFDSTNTTLEEAPPYKVDFAVVRPELHYTNETNGRERFMKPRIRFWCDFKEHQTPNLFYWIAWYINDVFIKQEEPQRYPTRDKTNLHEDELIQRNYKLGITINCIVRISTNASGLQGNRTASPGYWMGVEVINPNVYIQQGKTTAVQLRPTFPFGCYILFSVVANIKCTMSVQMYDPYDKYDCASTSISVKDSSRCGVQLPGLPYNASLPGQNYTSVITNMTITTKDANEYSLGRRNFVLTLVTESGFLANDIIGGNFLTDINVVIEETSSWKEKYCYAHTDPYMKTFDGIWYQNQDVGVFIMYRHRSNKQEVQIRTTSCRGSGWSQACVCAVAVRAGGDLFIMSTCNTPRLIKFVSCAESILKVTRMTPTSYRVWMPLGTIVDIRIYADQFLDTDIYPSVKDVNETQGLCGILNGLYDDDFRLPSGLQTPNQTAFLTSWRIPIEQSFFNPVNFNPSLWDASSYLCVCPAALNTTTTPSTVSGNRFSPLCSASLYLSCTKKVVNQGKPYSCPVRTVRSETSRIKELERIFLKHSTNDDESFEIHRWKKRQAMTYTLEEAFTLCSNIFDANCTTVFEGRLPETSMMIKNDSLTNCAHDIVYTGDFTLANVHCVSYRSAVGEEINRNSTYREENPDVVNSFPSMTCISNCSFHGDCINGSCLCHQSYVEEDCSVSLNVHPDVHDTYNGGVCKRDEEDCCGDKPIYGIYFVEGITKQKSERLQRYADGTEIVLETIISEIIVINKYEGKINVPCYSRNRRSNYHRNTVLTFVSGLRVSLTNDGKNYGTPQTYFTYDSRCQGALNATNGYDFYLMNGTCFIDDECYIDGNQNPLDSCKSCMSSVNPYIWMEGCIRSKNNPPSPTDNLITIVASVVSSAVGLAMLIVFPIILYKCCCKKETKVCGTIQANIMATYPGNTHFHESDLQCHSKHTPDHETGTEREPSYQNSRMWGERPGTAKDISLDFFEPPRPL